MNDDWRVRVRFDDQGGVRRLGETLAADELEHDLQRSFADRVVVSADGPDVFLYTADRAQAEAAERLVQRLAGEHEWTLETELRRWHPVAEVWEDPDNPEPVTAGQVATEASIRDAGDRRDSAEQGFPEYEVRITCESRRAAGELSDRLEDDGIANIHRWNFVLVGAADEPNAEALAARLRDELPDADVIVELNGRKLWDNLPANPFAWLGGLAG